MKYSGLALTLLALQLSMFAASTSAPAITNSTINYTNSQITISGQNFTSTPTVTFNKINVPVVSVNSAQTQIVATLPSNIAAGTYLLTVINAAMPNQPGTFHVTYGAAGPPGPMGPQGATGATGPAGPQGLFFFLLSPSFLLLPLFPFRHSPISLHQCSAAAGLPGSSCQTPFVD